MFTLSFETNTPPFQDGNAAQEVIAILGGESGNIESIAKDLEGAYTLEHTIQDGQGTAVGKWTFVFEPDPTLSLPENWDGAFS